MAVHGLVLSAQPGANGRARLSNCACREIRQEAGSAHETGPRRAERSELCGAGLGFGRARLRDQEMRAMASRRLLLVEDSSTMLRMLAMMLREEGYDVKT